MTDLQLVCLYALEDMTLKKLNKLYFDDEGIGYTKRVISGEAEPMEVMMRIYYDNFPLKYKRKVEADRKYEKEFKGW